MQLKDAKRSPGEHLRAELARLGLDQGEAASALGVSRQSINNILNDRQPISRFMSRKLGKLTRRSDDYWLRDSFKGRKGTKTAKRKKKRPLKREKPRTGAKKKGIEELEPFRSFVLKLPYDADLVNQIKQDPKFPAVKTWNALRIHLLRSGPHDERLVTARMLWTMYRKS